MKQNNSNNNVSLSKNFKHLNNYSNKNKIVNFGKINSDDFDQTRNKFSLKFFEKLGITSNKNKNKKKRKI